ncbi:MAG: UbiA family prenyltransferase, partial [Alkalibacterium sp.]|uniref:UbiA family prenyltransferase n=1 Tax=Alkalibacterium sp. TaxID=1872447 RepID=UPI0026472E0C
FFWQFPHFWALGWWLYDDYKRGGFFMLPTGKRDKGTAIQIILYTVWTIIASLIPVLKITGDFYISPISAFVILALGIFMLYRAFQLYKTRETKAARALMLASVSYISFIQIVYVLDKYIRLWI